jgi:actin-related protein 6
MPWRKSIFPEATHFKLISIPQEPADLSKSLNPLEYNFQRMPRVAKAKAKPISSTTLVLDNGAYNIKAGLISNNQRSDAVCKVVPNCIARDRTRHTWIAGQLAKCRDFGEMSFRRPVEKGYVVSWEVEREIWEETFFDKNALLAVSYSEAKSFIHLLMKLNQCDPHDTNLILTEAPNAPQVLQTNCDQIVFEEYEFSSYFRCIGE